MYFGVLRYKVYSRLNKRNPDGSYDIHGHVSYGELPNLNWVVRDGRFTVRFRNVYGSFNCEMCGLNTFKGSPSM